MIWARPSSHRTPLKSLSSCEHVAYRVAKEDVGDTVAIDLIDKLKNTSEPMTFVFVEPGVIVSESKAGEMHYRRVE